MSSTKEIVHQGWLTKSPPNKGIFRPRWRRRWFILRSGTFPNQFVLEYFTDESCRRQKGKINLDECEQICGPLNVQDRHKYTFHLRTPNRIYYLAADTEPDMKKWVEGLCQVWCLKIVEDEADGTVVYTKPSNENNEPLEVESSEVHHESDGSSPTPSNKSPSGPYIPISECFTGKPIIFNPTQANEEVTYYNLSSFPFPPKVNWATYPTKNHSKDANEAANDSKNQTGQRSNDASYVPPRPPKKTSSKPTTPTSTTPQAKPSTGPKSPDQVHSPTGHSAGIYENVDEGPDSPSTSSSLHSPPSSAGGLYCNINDGTESKTAGATVNPNPSSASKPATSPSPSSTTGNPASAIPPKVDRNLKPEVKKASEIHAALKNHQLPLASNAQSRLGCMTLPNKSSQNNFCSNSGPYYPGPEIDRTRKPSDGNLTLGSTPAQLKYQSAIQNNSRNPNVSRMNTNTLPSQRRRAGPLISPHEKKSSFPLYHDHESTVQLSGTYMQIDCKTIKETEARSQALKQSANKKLGVGPVATGGSVEHKVIDHVKTKALNQMRMEREKQLETKH